MNKLIKYFNEKYGKEYGKISYPRTTIQIYRVYQAIKSYGIKDGKLVELLHNVKLPKPKSIEEKELYTDCLYNKDDSEIVIDTSNLISKENPVFTGSISLGRKEGSTIGGYSVAVGYDTEASGYASHAEGDNTVASGNQSHAEGELTEASGYNSHAEGYNTTASNTLSHAEGNSTIASGNCSHAEGDYTTASGNCSHAEGSNTTALSDYQHVQGKYNIEDAEGKYAYIVGNGTNTSKSNAHTLDWEGNAWYAGKLSQGRTPTEDKDLTTKKYVDTSLNNKVDKVNGKGLSTVDFTTAYETKLKGLENYNDATIKKDINDINTQLGDIVNNHLVISVKDFGAKGDDINDDTKAIQSAIDFVSNYASSVYNNDYFGVVKMPKGVYKVTNLIMKSNVHIEGEGIAITRINPIGTSGYVFDCIGTDRNAKLVQCDMKDFTISPKDRFSSSDYHNRPNVGGINFNFVERVSLRNIKINGITGIGLRNVESFDCYFDNLEFVYVGSDANTPAVLLDGTEVDSTNALHFFGCRFEACSCMLKLTIGVRQIQFLGCKFVYSVYDDVPIRDTAGIIIDQCNSNTFSACGFVGGNNVVPLIKIGTNKNDIRGLKFVGCDFIAGEQHNSLGVVGDISAVNVTLSGCSFTGFGKCVETKGNTTIIGCEFIDCNAPNVTMTYGKISECDFQFVNLTGGALVLLGGVKCVGNTISSLNSTSKGIVCSYNALLLGNTINAVTTAIEVSGTGNIIRSNVINNAKKDYDIVDLSNNLIEHYWGTSISNYAPQIKNIMPVDYNYNRIYIHNGSDFLSIPIIKFGSTEDEPKVGRFPGMLYYNTTIQKLTVFNGSSWEAINTSNF